MSYLSNFLRYLYRVGLALSVLLNVTLGGYSNQTFSARNHEWKKKGKLNLVFLINFLTMDDMHCLKCYCNWVMIKDSLTKKGYNLW